MKVNGKMIYNMAMELNNGLMALNMKEITFMERSQAKVSINGEMDLYIRENGWIIKSMEEEYTHG